MHDDPRPMRFDRQRPEDGGDDGALFRALDAIYATPSLPPDLPAMIRAKAKRAAIKPDHAVGAAGPVHGGRSWRAPGARIRRSRSFGRVMTTAASLVAVMAAIVALVALRPAPSAPSGTAAPGVGIAWMAVSADLIARTLRIETPTGVFTGVNRSRDLARAHAVDARHVEMTVQWAEAASAVDLRLSFSTDATDWWLSGLRVSDGMTGDAVEWHGRLVEAPLGKPWTGDLHLTQGSTSGPAVWRLDLTGASLQAFAPGTIPPTLLDCRNVVDPATGAPPMRGVTPLTPLQPLAGTGVERMTPTAAAELLDSLGLCHLFGYSYDFTSDAPDGASGFGETWCDPPPGRIEDLWYDSLGAVRISVVDAVPTLHTPRPQPDVGWGCESR